MVNKITTSSKNNHTQCKMIKKLLDREGANYQEINIDERPDMIDYVKNPGSSAAPVVEASDTIFSGFRPAKLKEII